MIQFIVVSSFFSQDYILLIYKMINGYTNAIFFPEVQKLIEK